MSEPKPRIEIIDDREEATEPATREEMRRLMDAFWAKEGSKPKEDAHASPIGEGHSPNP